MIEEAYCSFEVAKLLKEKGFNNDYPKGDCTQIACTHQMAMAWLRERYNIHIAIYTVDKTLREKYETYTAALYYIDDDIEIIVSRYGISGEHIYGKTYEETVEESLKYILKNVIS